MQQTHLPKTGKFHALKDMKAEHLQMYDALKCLIAAKMHKDKFGKSDTYKSLAEHGWRLAQQAINLVENR